MPTIPVSINARQRSIIFTLLKLEGRITLEELSRQTGLTPRVIRYNLDLVTAWFRSQSINVICRPGYGIEIDASRQARKRVLEVVAGYDDRNLILTGAQRRRVLLLDLLSSGSPISFRNLAAQEGISRSTLIHDVNEMETWLDRYQLVFTRRTNTGVYIEGSESSRRFALVNLLREELGEEKWSRLWAECETLPFNDKSLPVNIETYIQKLPLAFCRRVITNIEKNIGRRLTLNAHAEVLVYTAIMMDALQRGLCVAEVPDTEITHLVEYEVASIFLTAIARKFQVEIPGQEIKLFAAYLLSSKWVEASYEDASGSAPTRPPQPLSLHFASAIISACSAQLHPLLQIDSELNEGLVGHLDRTLYSLRYGIPITNPLLNTILELYPEVYRSAHMGVAVIEHELKIPVPAEEVGFVTMHLAAGLDRLRTNRRVNRSVILISDGIRSKTTLLKARLEYEFSNLEISCVLNGDDLEEIATCRAEALISLVPIEHPQIPVIQVSPFLTTHEAKAIRNWLDAKEENERRTAFRNDRKPTLVDLLEPANVVFARTEIDWKQVVRLASRPLIQSNKIEHSYVEAMIEIIEEHGPYMILAPGVILLHARPTDGVNSLSLSLLLLEKGVCFGSPATGEIHVVFVLGAVDGQNHLTALFQLNDLIQNPEFVDLLRRSTSPADVLRAIWSRLTFEDVQAEAEA